MDRKEPLGHSLALEDGDIVLEDGALKTATGKRNLLQALELQVLTPFGSDVFNTTYGLDVKQAFTQPGSVRMVKELIKLNLVRTLATDPRVRNIRQVLFEDDPAYLAQHPLLNPETIRAHKRQRIWQVEVIIETVQDQTESVSLNIGV